ncbi:TPA: hypothetical protein P0E15_004976 [Vibrio harveyi]|nr:hypothetical protein [Vibrio harveyi]
MSDKQSRKLTIDNVGNESFNNIAEMRKAMQASSMKPVQPQPSNNGSRHKPEDKKKPE